MNSFDVWRLLAGVAFFLLGMNMLETALKELSGRSFKLFLKKQASHQLTAIGSGAIVTAILQSSSVVNLMVLAFVGAGLMDMQHALGVTLGANLGTTLSTWIVATLGFQINIENYALPVLGTAGIAIALLKRNTALHKWGTFLFGFGLLFFGLGQMRSSIEDLVSRFDFTVINDYPLVVFVLAGIVITSLIQSSSATVAIVLSALHAGVFPLYTAMAIVLGSEIGTTLKLLIASIGAMPVKKRVALGNFLFNTASVIIVFIFLGRVNYFITGVLSIKDELIALSFFQTFINVVSIIVFFPFLRLFGRFLERQFVNDGHETAFIHKVSSADPELALEALEKETGRFLTHIVLYCRKVLGLEQVVIATYKDFAEKDVTSQYLFIKQLHGDIYNYQLVLQGKPHDKETTARLEALVRVVRNGMYAAKSMKDASQDAEQLHNSSTEVKYRFFKEEGSVAGAFYGYIYGFIEEPARPGFEELIRLYKDIQAAYNQSLHKLYKEQTLKSLEDVDISTVINFNHEVYTSLKAMVFAVKDFRLSAREAEHFDEIPGFIR